MKQLKGFIQLKERSLTLNPTVAVILIFRKRCTRFLKNMKNIKKKQTGIHGKTAQYWFGYIRMVQLYHQFLKNIRTGDLKLYIFCIERLLNFFTFNHSNYARCLVRYHDNLLKLKKTHPQTHEEFLKGCF